MYVCRDNTYKLIFVLMGNMDTIEATIDTPAHDIVIHT